jgi:putative oxidoreductase
MRTLHSLALLAGRILIAAIFIYDAMLIGQYPAENHSFIQSFGVPGFLLWPAAALQLVGGVLVVIGLATRIAALALGAFCLLTAAIFHTNFADTMEAIQFGKDIGLAGGFLFLSANGPGAWSVEGWRARR